MPRNSYTVQLAKNPQELAAKIIEEATEVTTAKNREEWIWEIADLVYMVSVLMAREKIRPEEIWKELRGRS
jgi:phosphoribosyl-ATP pyrophosphohydrolase